MLVPLLASIFIVIVLTKVWLSYRERTIGVSAALLWSLMWLGVAVVVWQPEVANRLADFFGIGRGADLVVYVAIMSLAYISFRIFVRLDKLNRIITKLVRDIALHDKDKDRDSDRKL